MSGKTLGLHVMLPQRVESTYASVRGLVSYATEVWSAWAHIRNNAPLAVAMNDIAPAFFGTTHVGLYQTSLLLVRHLGEGAHGVGKGRPLNSSFRGLFAVAFGADELAWPSTLRPILERFLRISQPVRDLVSKLIAHTDLAVGIGEEPVPAVNELQVGHSVQLSQQLLNAYEEHSGLPTSDFSTSQLVANLGVLAGVLGRQA